MSLWPRILKSAYRREPIFSFLVTIGVVDTALGGLGERWSLTTFGLGTVGLAFAFRWWQKQQHRKAGKDSTARYYLPPASSRPRLPMLSINKKPPSI